MTRTELVMLTAVRFVSNPSGHSSRETAINDAISMLQEIESRNLDAVVASPVEQSVQHVCTIANVPHIVVKPPWEVEGNTVGSINSINK